ncbi:MAG: hypothetical protein ACRD1Z_01680, partial [Vicinamibacteria bacterium]
INRLFDSKREFRLRRKVTRAEESARWKRWNLWRPKQVGNELALALLDEELRKVVGRVRHGVVLAVLSDRTGE